jgi:hypothetical protein
MFLLCLVVLFIWISLAPLTFFYLYGLFLGAFYRVLVDLLLLDLKIGEKKYIKAVIFSLKYVVSHIFKS